MSVLHVLAIIGVTYAVCVAVMFVILLLGFGISRRDAANMKQAVPAWPITTTIIASLLWPAVIVAFFLGRMRGRRLRREAIRVLAMSVELRDGMREIETLRLRKAYVRLRVARDVAEEARRGDDEDAQRIADHDLEAVRREVAAAERLVDQFGPS